jgi:ketosteroid isomerase-like protein
VIAVTVSLPEPIQGYFRAVDDDDTDALVACFDDDAEVADEGTVRRGRDEIRAWREQTRSAYGYTAEVLGAEIEDDSYIVATRLTGSFPGSPVEMPYRFTLRGGLIGRLDIDP